MQKKILREQVRPPDSHYNVNITLSDIISMDRTVIDTRPQVKINSLFQIRYFITLNSNQLQNIDSLFKHDQFVCANSWHQR